MSTHIDCLHLDAAIRRRLTKLLANDGQRQRPPVSLPGKPVPRLPALSPPPSLPPAPRKGGGPLWTQYLGRDRPQRLTAEVQPEDVIAGSWTREQLLKMDAAFTRAVERAFQRGAESPAAAGTTGAPRRDRS